MFFEIYKYDMNIKGNIKKFWTDKLKILDVQIKLRYTLQVTNHV
jgi:hypothetical protein